MSRHSHKQSRRDFIKTTAVAAAGVSLAAVSRAESKASTIAIVPDSDDKLVKEPPVQWAIEQLRDAFDARGITAQILSDSKSPSSDAERVIIASRLSPLAREHLTRENIS